MAKNMDTIHTGSSYGDVKIEYYNKEEFGGLTTYYDDRGRVVAVAEEIYGDYGRDGEYGSLSSGNYDLTVYSYDGDSCSHITHYEGSKITECDFEKHADGHISAHVEMSDTNPDFWEPASEDKDVHYVLDPETEHYVEMTPEQYEAYQDTGVVDGIDVDGIDSSGGGAVTEEILDGIARDRDFPIVDADISADGQDGQERGPIERDDGRQVVRIDMYSQEPWSGKLDRVEYDGIIEYDRAVETDGTISYYDSDDKLVATKEDISDNEDSRTRVTIYYGSEESGGITSECKYVLEDRGGFLESVEIIEREQGIDEYGEPYVREIVDVYAYQEGVEQGSEQRITLYEYNPDTGDVIITREGNIGDAAPFEIVSPGDDNYREICEYVGVDNIEHENIDREAYDSTEREPDGDRTGDKGSDTAVPDTDGPDTPDAPDTDGPDAPDTDGPEELGELAGYDVPDDFDGCG